LPGTFTSNNPTYSSNDIFMDIELRTNGVFIGHTFTVNGPGFLALRGRLSGSILASLTKNGTGRLQIVPAPGIQDDAEGPAYIDSGVLGVEYPGALSPYTAVTVASGAALEVFRVGGIGSLAGAGRVTLLLADTTLSVGYNNVTSTFSGVVTGSGSLNKVGTGTFTLAGANIYTGPTAVQSGTLSFGADNSASSSSAVTVA